MTKDCSITISGERKRGPHLETEERGAIQALKKLGYSNRAITRVINCSPSTVGYELKRGTPAYSGRGRRPGYSAKHGGVVYHQNRSRCRRPKSVPRESAFLCWLVQMVRQHKWSFDTCVGTAQRKQLFSDTEIPVRKHYIICCGMVSYP